MVTSSWPGPLYCWARTCTHHYTLYSTALYCTVLYSARTRMVSTRARAAIISALSAAAPPPPPAAPRLDTQLLPGHSRAVTALSVSGARARAGGK